MTKATSGAVGVTGFTGVSGTKGAMEATRTTNANATTEICFEFANTIFAGSVRDGEIVSSPSKNGIGYQAAKQDEFLTAMGAPFFSRSRSRTNASRGQVSRYGQSIYADSSFTRGNLALS